jgi:tRNA threonylcarbamoyl adenosine modification protein YeaZ
MLGGVTEAARLFLETSTPRASLVLMRGSEVVSEESFMGDRSHNALLFAPLERALACLAEGERLAEVVVGSGPGSYSGTRVGIAAGQGVAMVHGCPAVALSSLLAVAPAEPGALAVGDARRGSGWWMRIGGAREPELCGMEELARGILEALEEGRPVFSVEPVGGMGLPEDLVARVALERPEARGLAAAWMGFDDAERSRWAAVPPQPAYLRPPHVTVGKAGHPLLRK